MTGYAVDEGDRILLGKLLETIQLKDQRRDGRIILGWIIGTLLLMIRSGWNWQRIVLNVWFSVGVCFGRGGSATTVLVTYSYDKYPRISLTCYCNIYRRQ